MHDKDQYSGICNNYKADSHSVVYCQLTFPCYKFKLGKETFKESITSQTDSIDILWGMWIIWIPKQDFLKTYL